MAHRTLSRQLTWRLDAPEGPGAAEFKRYLTPQLVPSQHVPDSLACYYQLLGALVTPAEKETEHEH